MSLFHEKNTGRLAKQLARFPYYGTDKVLNVLEYQDNKEQVLISSQHLQEYFRSQESQLTTAEKIKLYRSLFRGRQDVYAKSYINKEGKIQYYPSYHYGWRQLPPEKRMCEPFTEDVLKSHLRGEASIGLFPISQTDTCAFLAIDFDKKDWRDAVSVLRKTAEQQGFEAHVEISRSGNGAHVWFFFEEEIPCQQARKFGKILLELAMQESQNVSFSSFDRFFPNQDFLPKGGFGNLIALPLQGKAYAEGRTVFVDADFQPYLNQWGYLQSIVRIGRKQLEKILDITVVSQQDDRQLALNLSNVLTVQKASVSAKTAHFLKSLASFANPEFYLKQATRQPTYQTPERIYLFEETDEALRLPRGLLPKLEQHFERVSITDSRYRQAPIKVSFTGQLHVEQETALADLLSRENGLLCAETGFGKTVLGAALIAERQKRTVILVHNRQLLEQWLERLGAFLTFEEEEAVRYTPSGRERIIGHIGQYGAAKKWRSQLVDVVMIQSLFQLEHVESFLADYDMMIVDECHHVTALQFEKVVAQFAGQYLYGLTATPERKNGHEPIVFQRIGEILHKAESVSADFTKYLTLRFTSFGKFDTEKSKSTNFTALNDWLAQDGFRNQMIGQDIVTAYQNKRKILVLVNRVDHIEILRQALLEKKLPNVFQLNGQTKRKLAREILTEITELPDKAPFVLLSTGKYVGEGFDLPKLDTLMLAAPLSWKNNLIQYAGRLHRPYQEKSDVRIFDYLDIHVPYLEKMYQKRQIAYRKMAYQLEETDKRQSLFDVKTYEKVFREDLQALHSNLFIKTASLTTSKTVELLAVADGKNITLQIPSHHKLSAWLKGLENEYLAVDLIDEKITTNLFIFDNSLVWYGSISPLGYRTDDNGSLLRLESSEIAEEFLESMRDSGD